MVHEVLGLLSFHPELSPVKLRYYDVVAHLRQCCGLRMELIVHTPTRPGTTRVNHSCNSAFEHVLTVHNVLCAEGELTTIPAAE